MRQVCVFNKDKEVEMMRKLSLFLLGLLLWGAAYSTPASILQYKIEPTEAQKAEFFRKASKDPELYSYNPMHVGNVWWYERDWDNPEEPEGPAFVGREIVDSLSIEGDIHYLIRGGLGAPNGFWVRNVGDVTILWDHHNEAIYDDLDNNPETNFLNNEDFSITGETPDEATHVWSLYWPTFPFGCYLVDSGWIDYFGCTTQFRLYNYFPPYGDAFYSLMWVRGFGPVFLETEWGQAYLVACRINSVTYGDVPSANNDEITQTIPDIKLNATPNPSQYNFVIYYEIPLKYQKVQLQIFNMRGQIVRDVSVQDTGNFLWNCKDMNDIKVPSGLYFIKIKTSDGLGRVIKITVIK